MRAAPTQIELWPYRFFGLGRYAPAKILRTAVRLTGRAIRAESFDAPVLVLRSRGVAIDPIATILAGCAELVRLIGRLEPSETPQASAWISVDRTSPVPVVRLHARGTVIQGDRISRALVNGRVVETDQTTGAQKLFSMDAVREAAQAARSALLAAGIALSTFGEVRPTRQGGVAIIGLRRVPTIALKSAMIGA